MGRSTTPAIVFELTVRDNAEVITPIAWNRKVHGAPTNANAKKVLDVYRASIDVELVSICVWRQSDLEVLASVDESGDIGFTAGAEGEGEQA